MRSRRPHGHQGPRRGSSCTRSTRVDLVESMVMEANTVDGGDDDWQLIRICHLRSQVGLRRIITSYYYRSYTKFSAEFIHLIPDLRREWASHSSGSDDATEPVPQVGDKSISLEEESPPLAGPRSSGRFVVRTLAATM